MTHSTRACFAILSLACAGLERNFSARMNPTIVIR